MPSRVAAASSAYSMCCWRVSILCATNVEPQSSAKLTGPKDRSTEPIGEFLVFSSCGEVGEYRPLERPQIYLLKDRIYTSTLRRRMRAMGLPPIESPSPSPVTTLTESSGFALLMPVAKAAARP